MENVPTVFTSNCMEVLVDRLRETLISNPRPFADQRVFIPNTSMKNQLITKLLTSDIDIISGIQFSELGGGIHSLFKMLSGKNLNFPPLDILSLYLESLISENSGSAEFDGYDPIHLQSLGHALAKEFLRYGKYGGKALKNWRDKGGWQQSFWHKIFSDWNFPYQLLEGAFKPLKTPVEVHLFALPFYPELYHQFFQKAAPHLALFFYQLSPCREFWTDAPSHREVFLFGQGEEDRSLLEEHNALLVNFGKLSRKTARFFEDSDLLTNEEYQSPPASLLGQVQKDILDDICPGKTTLNPDGSLVLRGASSKLREVEILYENLIYLSYLPSEVQIYAPDIAAYSPYIELVFGSDDSPFDFQVQGLPRLHESRLLQLYTQLINLSESRFDLKSVSRVLSHPYIYSGLGLKEKEVELFLGFMEKLEVKWGLDIHHRDQLIGRPMLEKESCGTWKHAFHRLLFRLAFIGEKPSIWNLPYLEFTQAEMAGRCIELISQLKKVLDELSIPKTLKEWATFLRSLLETHIKVPEEELNHLYFLHEKLSLLASLGSRVSSRFPFASVKRFLESSFRDRSGYRQSKSLECLTFSSLKLGNVFPAKVVYLLGMQEEAFPRVEMRSSLSHFDGDFCPTTFDEDRSLFLDLLVTTKEQLHISYLEMNEKDGHQDKPSALIQELITYLEKHYGIDEKKLKRVHPPFPFHHTSKGVTFSMRHHQTALSFYNQKEVSPFVPEFYALSTLGAATPDSAPLSIRKLTSFVKHPLRFYFQQVLGIYLRYEEGEAEFSLSPLNKAIIQKSGHHLSFDQSIQEANRHGKLPSGRFKEVAIEALRQEKPLETLEEGESITVSREFFGYQVEGVINHVTPDGLLFMGKEKDLVQVWPEFLVFSCLEDLEVKKELIITESGKTIRLEDPQQSLKHFLDYYSIAQGTPSPLLPSMLPIFMKKTPKEFEKALNMKLKQGNDPYLNSAFSSYKPEVVFKTWSSLAKGTFSELEASL